MTNDPRLIVAGVDLPERSGRVTLVERLHEPYRAEVIVPIAVRAIDRERLLGARAELQLREQTILGVVDEIEEAARSLRLVIRPRVAQLGSTRDYRVFVGVDAIAIAKETLGRHGVELEIRVGRTLTKLAQLVQDESDLDLVSRVLAREGLVWFSIRGTERVAIAEGPSGHREIDGSETLPFADDSALAARECVHSIELAHAIAIESVRLHDYDHEHPNVDLRVSTPEEGARIRRRELAGGYRDPGEGAAVAARRLEEERAGSVVLRGRSTSPRLTAGSTFTLEGAPREEANGTWLITEVTAIDEQTTAGARAFEARFSAIPASRSYRPRRWTHRASGVRTATITGPRGAEIHTTDLGHATVALRFDRAGKTDESSSRNVRSLQPFIADAMFLPRVGWEALVSFSSRGADEPFVLGRLDHGAARPAEALPAKKVRSAFGSRTTPGGGGANAFVIDDAAGSEGFSLNATKDHNELTGADKTVGVAASDTHSIGANRDHTVGAALQLGVKGAQTLAVGGSRSVGVGAARVIDAGSESIAVGGTRTLTIGGDHATRAASFKRSVGGAKVEIAIDSHHRHVTGASLVMAGACLSEDAGAASMVGVLGLHTRTSGGPINIRTPSYVLKGASITEVYGSHDAKSAADLLLRGAGSASIKVGGAASFKASAPLVVKATSKISINAGGAEITITPSAVTLKGPFKEGDNVKITGSHEVE